MIERLSICHCGQSYVKLHDTNVKCYETSIAALKDSSASFYLFHYEPISFIHFFHITNTHTHIYIYIYNIIVLGKKLIRLSWCLIDCSYIIVHMSRAGLRELEALGEVNLVAPNEIEK